MSEKFHIRNESNISPEIAKQLRRQFQKMAIESIESKQEEALLIGKENRGLIDEALGEGAVERIGMTYRYIFEMFAERGITKPEINPVLLFPESLPNSQGHSGFSHVEIGNVHIHDAYLRQMTTLKLMAHELYHSVGSISLDITVDKNELGKISSISSNIYAAGAGYGDAMVNSALEEGAAVIFENEMLEKIKTLFPAEAVQEYDRLIGLAAKEEDKRNPGIYDGTIVINNLSEKKETFESKTNGYTPSYRLVMYLRSQIPDFDKILEKLRVQRQPLDLAREIEKKFGKEMFRKLVTCKTDQAQALLEELQLKELSA